VELRITHANDRPVRVKGDHVLYWMIAARRSTFSFALDHALALAKQVERPLLVLEALRAGYRWASDRHHRFVIDGMADNAKAFARAGITYMSYVEPEPGAGKGLVEALAKRACAIVTDEYPGFFLPHMVAALAARVDVRVDLVDGCGVYPMRAFAKQFVVARSFRKAWHEVPQLSQMPASHLRAPKAAKDAEVPGAILRRWKSAAIEDIPIDHGVAPVPYAGGSEAARETLEAFVDHRLARYAERSHPDADAASGMSPYLHFGHISAHEIVARVGPHAEQFLDELITWRELGFNFCFHRRDIDTLSALPAWAQATLAKHANDPRPERYTLAELAAARTGDPVWNAAQRQLLVDGRIHNYLRMLWGKKILEWSASPKQALANMIELNNKYAVDGRDPNSYNGILWTLGLFDRPWGPERKIFGTVRYMSSTATVKKLRMKQYMARWSAAPSSDRAR
jgi:deoxyribodipyrimidine photo-lyase